VKDQLVRERLERLAGLLFDKTGDIVVSLARIAGLRAGLPLELQRAAAFASPVLETGLMRHADPWRQQLVPGVVFDVGICGNRVRVGYA